MSTQKDLTDLDEFTSPVTVPLGTRPRDNAAGDVELIAQRLANRTRNLKNLVDPLATDAARKSQQNTFTKTQIINSEGAHADDPLISTIAVPGDDPTDLSLIVPPVAPGSNRWKLVLAAPTKSGSPARGDIYIGQPPDGSAFVNNARWHVGTQKWRQLDPTLPSTGFIGKSGQYLLSYVTAGAAHWADWPTNSGGDLIVGGNVACQFDFLYQGFKQHADWTIPLAGGAGPLLWQSDGSFKVNLAVGDAASWPLKVPSLPNPNETKLTIIHLLVEQMTTTASLAMLVRRTKGTATAFPTLETIATNPSTILAGIQQIHLAAAFDHPVDAGREYSVVWKPGNANDRIGRISMDIFYDRGPANLG
jgi:hypothetical protein